MHKAPWHVLHVVANHEKKVAQHLEVRSVEHYLPLYTERSRWTDRSVVLERPLFAGYIFARFPAQARIAVISTPSVIRLLDDTGTVSAEEIERIRKGLAEGYLIRPHPDVAIGTQVRVRGGVFDGVTGMVAELRQKCKVVIALAAVQRSFSLEADLGDLEVLASPTAASR